MVKDTYTGPSTSSYYGPDDLTATGNTLFYVGYDSVNGFSHLEMHDSIRKLRYGSN